MSKYINEYKDMLVQMLTKINDTQIGNIEKAAKLMSDAVMTGKSIYAFGPSHAGMIVEEMVYRAGGFALVNPIHAAQLMPNVYPLTIGTSIERLSGFATAILEGSTIKEGDFLLIHSVSARIPVVIEMAMKAKEKGITVVGIINMDFATNVTSLDPSGKMMYDFCDVVIDNCGALGDASIAIEGMDAKVAPTSTIAGAFIANSLIIKVCEILIDKGYEPPVIRSANVDGCNELNSELFKKYTDRIHYL